MQVAEPPSPSSYRVERRAVTSPRREGGCAVSSGEARNWRCQCQGVRLRSGRWLGESGECRVTVAPTQAGPSTEAPVPVPGVGLSHKHLGRIHAISVGGRRWAVTQT